MGMLAICLMGCSNVDTSIGITEQETTTKEEITTEATTEQSTKPVIIEPIQTERISKDGALHYNYFFQESGIIMTHNRVMTSTWENTEFKYVCDKEACPHTYDSCRANLKNGEEGGEYGFSIIYDNKVVLLKSICGNSALLDESTGSSFSTQDTWYTEIYEITDNNEFKKKVGSFEGGIVTTSMPYGVIKLGDKILFGASKELLRGKGTETGMEYTGSVYCIDLDNYYVYEFELFSNDSYPYKISKIYEYNGYVYVVSSYNISINGGERLTGQKWYRIDLVNENIQLIGEFVNQEVNFVGAIGDDVFYTYGDNKLYKRNLVDMTEMEFLSVSLEEVNAFVFDDKIAVMTNCENYGLEGYVEYTFLDKEGNIIEKHKYNEWIIFLDVVKDKLLYIKPFSGEEYWAEKSNLAVLESDGKLIGDFRGWTLDNIQKE